MMKKILSLSILAMACAPAFAQTMTAREAGTGKTVVSDGGAQINAACFYGGDFDTRNGLSSERNTAVTDSWIFDDIDWAGGMVSTGSFNFLDTGVGTPAGADLIVYSGMSEGNFGTMMGQATDMAVTTSPTGNSGFGYPEINCSWTAGGQAFSLAAGTYHFGMRVVGTGVGQCFVSTASGTNGVGTPLANGNVFFQSGYFGFTVPTDAQNVFGAGNWDVSWTVDCGGGGGGYTCNVSGSCPGTVTVAWNGATPNKQQAIVFAATTGNLVVPNGPCQGTQLGLSSQGIRVVNTISTGNGAGSVNGNAGAGACGGHIQLVTIGSPCVASTVGNIP